MEFYYGFSNKLILINNPKLSSNFSLRSPQNLLSIYSFIHSFSMGECISFQVLCWTLQDTVKKNVDKVVPLGSSHLVQQDTTRKSRCTVLVRLLAQWSVGESFLSECYLPGALKNQFGRYSNPGKAHGLSGCGENAESQVYLRGSWQGFVTGCVGKGRGWHEEQNQHLASADCAKYCSIMQVISTREPHASHFTDD